MKLIQVGIIAMRSSTGDFLPSQPIFRDVEDDSKSEKNLPIKEVEQIFINHMKKYAAIKKKQKKVTGLYSEKISL